MLPFIHRLLGTAISSSVNIKILCWKASRTYSARQLLMQQASSLGRGRKTSVGIIRSSRGQSVKEVNPRCSQCD
jgi:hypothetical protein